MLKIWYENQNWWSWKVPGTIIDIYKEHDSQVLFVDFHWDESLKSAVAIEPQLHDPGVISLIKSVMSGSRTKNSNAVHRRSQAEFRNLTSPKEI